MIRLHIFVFVFACMVLFLQPVAAVEFVPVEVNIKPDYIKTDLQMPVIFNMNIRNNQNRIEELRIAVEGPHIHWVTNPIILLVVPRNSTKEVNLTFYPVHYRGLHTFNIITSSHKSLLTLDTKNVTVYIPPPVVAENFSVSRDGRTVTASIDIETVRERQVDFETALLNQDGFVYNSIKEPGSIEGKATLTHTHNLPENPLAGQYTVTYNINNNMTGNQSFTVEPIHKIERSERLEANVMFGVVKVTYKNLGNIAEYDYPVQEMLPKTTITGFITNPQGCDEGLVDKTCTYVIPELQPGATAQVSYRVEYWPYYIQIAAIAIIIFIFAGFSVLRVAKPSIIKTSVRKGANVHSVILEIKNPFLHHLKDVVIRDWVTPLAQVAKQEAGVLRPVLKRSAAGTELIWMLGEMRPKEVRYLSYKIKTLVEGNLKMPRAYARFRAPKSGRTRVYSKFLHID